MLIALTSICEKVTKVFVNIPDMYSKPLFFYYTIFFLFKIPIYRNSCWLSYKLLTTWKKMLHKIELQKIISL